MQRWRWCSRAPPAVFQLDPGRLPLGLQLRWPCRVLLALVAVVDGVASAMLSIDEFPGAPAPVGLPLLEPEGRGLGSYPGAPFAIPAFDGRA